MQVILFHSRALGHVLIIVDFELLALLDFIGPCDSCILFSTFILFIIKANLVFLTAT